MPEPNAAVHNSELELFCQDWKHELVQTAKRATRTQDKKKTPRMLGSSQQEEPMTGTGVFTDDQHTVVDSDAPRGPSLSNIFSFNRNSPFQDGSFTSGGANLTTEDQEVVVSPTNPRKIVLGLDYGTTFSSISYSEHPINANHLEALPWEVKSISNWPDAAASSYRKQVPTESWYSSVAPPRDPLVRGPNTSHRSVTGAMHQDSNDDLDGTSDEDEYEDQHQKSHTIIDQLFMDIAQDQNPSAEIINEEHPGVYLWGYSVPYQQYSANSDRDPWGLVKYAKTILLDTQYTHQDRQILEPLIDELIGKKIIRIHAPKGSSDPRNVADIITDFLTRAFIHARRQLEAMQVFATGCIIQFVMTVPTIWKPQSSRILQDSIAASIKASGFGTLDQGCVDNLIIISEPEAAATYLMSSSKTMLAGETFVLLDCGGGTVDAVSYTVDTIYPLRLGKEEVPADGDNCGGSYANMNFRNLIERRLKDETYLFTNGETKRTIVNRLMPAFEDDYKRRYDCTKRCWHRIRIPGLIGDEERPQGEQKRFQANYLIMNNSDYDIIFQPLLERIVNLLAKQLELVYDKGKFVKKVFLVGGFGYAPSVRSFLKKYLAHLSSKLPHEITLITDEKNSITAVSAGAVLRAHNMDHGPDRIAQSSYGFLRNEPYSPNTFAGHRRGTPFVSDLDGEDYVPTVQYFMFKTKEVPFKKQIASFTCIHTFPLDQKKLLCEEILYVLDREAESHYTKDDPMNEGLEVAGKILLDMTWLREKKIIRAVRGPKRQGRLHYRVVYDLVAFVEGRNLKYEARYPAGAGGKSHVQKTKQVSIAAAFEPGTK